MIYGEIGMYPGIMKVALEIAYDNGMVHRLKPEAEWLSSLDSTIQSFPAEKLVALNEFCSSLSDEDIHIMAAGEQREIEELQDTYHDPEFCNKVFLSIFNEELS